jgi:hypothetical protein
MSFSRPIQWYHSHAQCYGSETKVRIRIRPAVSFESGSGFEYRIWIQIRILDSDPDQNLAKTSSFCTKIFTQPHLQT